MRLLTVKDVSEMIQAKPATIYQWAETGVIPCFKINGLLRFSEDDILTWIKNCKKESCLGYNPLADRRPRKGG